MTLSIGRPVSGAGRVVRRAGAAVALALLLVLGAMTAAGSPAHADGPAALFYGYVVADQDGTLPTRVRAFSMNGTLCGAAKVQSVGDRVGFYVMSVATTDTKLGCPAAGELVGFGLIYGHIDDGITAAQYGVMEPGVLVVVHLARSSEPAPIDGE